ncbi:uncharacterized protein C1orf105 homolog isoform X1 [Equus przewalskii]|uniref:Uncharacterized protein C1orf105 homolog isoform X1 n=1 Tax=Equus przewalskii TaxID=9798 RepID=A0ABM2F2C3_EQUPR|nr:PREDICTED: uncharacterized protein C1orf105 homolog isoform X1 [Equus przewalskii]
MEKREMKVSVPKFGKIPSFSEASLINKPLVLSLPKRSPHSSATFLVSSKKDMNLPIMFQVPDVLSKARRNQGDPMLIRNKQLCSMCREIKTVQSRAIIIPSDLKLSFKNFMNQRMMSLHPPKAQTVRKPSRGDIPTEPLARCLTVWPVKCGIVKLSIGRCLLFQGKLLRKPPGIGLHSVLCSKDHPMGCHIARNSGNPYFLDSYIEKTA